MKKIGDFWLPDPEQHFVPYAKAGAYQRNVLNVALPFVTSWKFAIDIGAHVGFWSAALADKLFTRVAAFEPAIENVKCLERNTPNSVTIIPYALGAAAGKLQFHNPAPSNCGAWERTVDPTAGTPVIVHTLDSYRFWEDFTVGLIKIDVQGMEADVLAGARETITRCKPVVIVEVVCHDHIDPACAAIITDLKLNLVASVKADRIYTCP